jgi:hypothetical protein
VTRWAMSHWDSRVHLLTEEQVLAGVLTARCGFSLPTDTHRHDQPPPGSPCERCRRIFIMDHALEALAVALADSQIPGRAAG